MSLDSYFCFCCLSTEDLLNLYSSSHEDNYADILKESFSIDLLQENCAESSYICVECATQLRNTCSFKRQALNTIHILEKSGLIKLTEVNGTKVISRPTDDDIFEDSKHEVQLSISKSDSKHAQSEPAKKPKIIILKNELQITNIENTHTIKSESKSDGKRIKVKKPRNKIDFCKELPEGLQCIICTEVLPTKQSFHRHINRHFPNYVCHVCGEEFRTRRKLSRHQTSHAVGPFRCDECQREFHKYNSYCAHRQRKHSTTPVYVCPSCPQRFISLTARVHHVRNVHHARTRVYKCTYCDKTFLLAGLLSAHISRIHLKRKLHSCDVCSAKFMRKGELASHTAAVHTGVKEFHCEVCAKAYASKKALIVHLRLHSKNRPFNCDVCKKGFTQKVILQKHQLVHQRRGEVPS